MPSAGREWLPFQTRLAAAVFDHTIAMPPSRGSETEKWTWLEREAGRGSEGVLFAWESLVTDDSSGESSPLDRLRQRHPSLPLAAYSKSPPGSPLRAAAVRALEEGKIDHLFFVLPSVSDQHVGEIPTVAAEETAQLLLMTRLLLDRFGFAPAIYPVFSSRGSAKIRDEISHQIKAIGAHEARGDTPPDLLLFVYLPGTREDERASFVAGIELTLEKEVRVALLDLSNPSSPANNVPSMLSLLRERKWLDRLAAYVGPLPWLVSPAPSGDAPIEIKREPLSGFASTVATGISQSVLFLASLQFLRDDYDRLMRVDRAQVALLLAQSLSTRIHEADLTPLLADETNREGQLAALQRWLLKEGETLFREQFWRNVHAIQMTTGERVRFEMRLLQRLQIRFLSRRLPGLERDTLEVDLRPGIHTAPLRSLAPRIDQSTAIWELADANLPPRLAQRWANLPWWRMRVDVDRVRLVIKIAGKEGASLPAEGYRIRNRRQRSMRVIEIHAATEQGAAYGLIQLSTWGLRGELAQDMDRQETPQLAVRGLLDTAGSHWSQRARLDLLAFLGQHRLNHYAWIPVGESFESILERLPSLLTLAQEQFIELAVSFNPPPRGTTTSVEEDSPSEEWASRIQAMTRLGVRRFLFVVDPNPQRQTRQLGPDGPLTQILTQWSQLAPGAGLTLWVDRLDESTFKAQVSSFRERFPNLPLHVLGTRSGEWGILSLASRSNSIPCLLPPSPFHPGRPVTGGVVWPNSVPQSPLPYALHPQVAAAAGHLWAPSQHSPEDAFDSFLTTEPVRIRTAVRTWIEATQSCDIPPEATTPALEEALRSLRGSRAWGLLRGELSRTLSSAKLPHPLR